MGLISLGEILREAESGRYAVGYFESWNLESLLAVWEAAEETHSPVIIGFSGDPKAMPQYTLEICAAMGLAVCRLASVKIAFIYNESPHLTLIRKAIGLGFNIVEFNDENLSYEKQKEMTRKTVLVAHDKNVAVEKELQALPVMKNPETISSPSSVLTDPKQAREFVEETGIDALGVAIGNVHVVGSRRVGLDIGLLDTVREQVSVPLVLHGGSGIDDEAVRAAIAHGIRKVNVGAVLRRVFFDAVRDKISRTDPSLRPYRFIGSGSERDILQAGKMAVKELVKQKMRVYGSAGKS